MQIHSEAWHSNRTKILAKNSVRWEGVGICWAGRGGCCPEVFKSYLIYILCDVFDISDIYLQCPLRYIWYVYICYILFVQNINFLFSIIQMFGFVHIITGIACGKVLYLRLQINNCLLHTLFCRFSQETKTPKNKQTHFSWTHHLQNKYEASVFFIPWTIYSVIVLSLVFRENYHVQRLIWVMCNFFKALSPEYHRHRCNVCNVFSRLVCCRH